MAQVEKKQKPRTLWVCIEPGCGVAFCCEIPALKPSYPLWCDNPCHLNGLERCTRMRGYTGDPENPYKPEILEKMEKGEEAPFIVEKGKCPEHFIE